MMMRWGVGRIVLVERFIILAGPLNLCFVHHRRWAERPSDWTGPSPMSANSMRTSNSVSPKGSWDGFSLRLRYANLWEEGGRTGRQVRVILNFPISML